MNDRPPGKDLVVLVADLNMEQTVRGLLERPNALGVRRFTFDVYRHPHRDPGCRREAAEFLRPLCRRYANALVLFDFHGCGAEDKDPRHLEELVEVLLRANGWEDRAAAVVINPELEAWIWSDSKEVDRVLGWGDKQPALRDWLRERELLGPGSVKPDDPKRAVEVALREVRALRTSARYRALAERVVFDECTDRAFGRFRQLLQEWYAREPLSTHA